MVLQQAKETTGMSSAQQIILLCADPVRSALFTQASLVSSSEPNKRRSIGLSEWDGSQQFSNHDRLLLHFAIERE
jgi:hypothetical protein